MVFSVNVRKSAAICEFALIYLKTLKENFPFNFDSSLLHIDLHLQYLSFNTLPHFIKLEVKFCRIHHKNGSVGLTDANQQICLVVTSGENNF